MSHLLQVLAEFNKLIQVAEAVENTATGTAGWMDAHQPKNNLVTHGQRFQP